MEKLDNRVKCPHCHCADYVIDISTTDEELYMVNNGFLKFSCKNPVVLANRQIKQPIPPPPDYCTHSHDYMMTTAYHWVLRKVKCHDWWIHKELLIPGTLRYKPEYVS